jgi:hypothetical protein
MLFCPSAGDNLPLGQSQGSATNAGAPIPESRRPELIARRGQITLARAPAAMQLRHKIPRLSFQHFSSGFTFLKCVRYAKDIQSEACIIRGRPESAVLVVHAADRPTRVEPVLQVHGLALG